MSGICKVKAVSPLERAVLPPDDREKAHWWVICTVCEPRAGIDMVAAMFGVDQRHLGWAPDYAVAVEFADAHATLHADRACPTCHYLPPGDVSHEDTQALMQARKATA